jgi:preprotein translocase subunit SecE
VKNMIDAKLGQNHVKVEKASPKALNFVHELKEELKKVSWTTKTELQFFTKVVVGSTFALGIGIYLMDLIVKGILDGIAKIAYFIFG